MGLHYSKNIVNFESFLLRFSSISEKWNRESSEENPFLLTSDELWLDYSTQIDADCSFLHHMFLSILVIRNWNRQLTLNLSLLPNLETNQFLADRYIILESGLKKKSTLAFFRQLIIYYYLLPPAYYLQKKFQDLRTFKLQGPSVLMLRSPNSKNYCNTRHIKAYQMTWEYFFRNGL